MTQESSRSSHLNRPCLLLRSHYRSDGQDRVQTTAGRVKEHVLTSSQETDIDQQHRFNVMTFGRLFDRRLEHRRGTVTLSRFASSPRSCPINRCHNDTGAPPRALVSHASCDDANGALTVMLHALRLLRGLIAQSRRLASAASSHCQQCLIGEATSEGGL